MFPFKDKGLSVSARVQDLLGRMTTTEKVGQLNQRLLGFASYIREGDQIQLTEEFQDEIKRHGGLGVLYGLYRADPWSKKDYSTGITSKMAPAAYNTAQKYVVEHSRFGIPALMSTECPHGHQALDGYLLPVNLAVGATMNPPLLEEAYELCGKQLGEMGVDLALISMLDILRDPRWGRSEECYGEDPYLAAKLAEAAIRGCKKAGVDVVAKHFCAQGETTGGVNASAARIGARELSEIHLPASEAAVKAGAAGFMAAYNEIDGIPCHGNPDLLRGVLRDQMGFDGIVMADGCAVDRLAVMTGTVEAAGAAALKAGVDVSLWDDGFALLAEAAEKDAELLQFIDAATERVLTLKFARGLMDAPYLDESKEITDFNNGSFACSTELARQSVVMLKNDGTLPLDSEGLVIAVIGPNGDDVYNMLGDYTPPVIRKHCVTLFDGVRDNSKNLVTVHSGCGIFVSEKDNVLLEEAVGAAMKADVVILALGGSSSRFAGETDFDSNGAAIVSAGAVLQMDCGEGVDTASLLLPGCQQLLAEKIFALGKKTVAVITGGRPYAIRDIDSGANALLYSFYPGPQGGKALGEIVFGLTSPSGRLPASLPLTDGQVPCYYNYRNSYVAMKYHDAAGKPLYAFGQGMNYGKLAYTDFTLNCASVLVSELDTGATIQLSFTCENTGVRDEYAVPMLFISAKTGSVVRRVLELKAFDKKLIQVGERHRFTLALDKESLSVLTVSKTFTPEKSTVALLLKDGFDLLYEKTINIM